LSIRVAFSGPGSLDGEERFLYLVIMQKATNRSVTNGGITETLSSIKRNPA
jgi:hypothetical protein